MFKKNFKYIRGFFRRLNGICSKTCYRTLNLKLDYVEIKIINYAINSLITNGLVSDEGFTVEDVYNLRKKLDELEKIDKRALIRVLFYVFFSNIFRK